MTWRLRVVFHRGDENMGRTICLCLLACLAVGLAVPVPELTNPGNEQELENLFLNAKPEDNDIHDSPVKNQVTEEAVIEKETEDPHVIADDTTELYNIATLEKIEEPAIAPKVNQTELPKETSTLEPTDENTFVVANEGQNLPSQPIREFIPSSVNGDYPPQGSSEETFEDGSQVVQIPEGLLNEGDLVGVVPDENQETFEDDTLVSQITEDQLTEDDLVDVVPEENQETFGDDEPVIPIFGGETMFGGEQIVSETDEQMPSEGEREVIVVFDENPHLMPIAEEEGLSQGEEDEEQIVQGTSGQVFSENEEIFIIDDESVPTPEREEGSFLPNIEEEQMAPAYNDFEETITTEFEDNEQRPALVMPEDSYFSEEPFMHYPNDDSIFGSPFPPSVEGMLPLDVEEELERRVEFDQIPDYASNEDTYTYDVSDNPSGIFPAPSEYYIPDEFSSDDENGNEEISAFPQNENDSFTDVSDGGLNEPMQMRNDNEAPVMLDILMIKENPQTSEGSPTIEVINTDFPQIPPQFVFGATLPVNDNQEPINSAIPDDGTFVNDSELPDKSSLFPRNMLSQGRIEFPDESTTNPILPVFPHQWAEENFYQPPRIQSQNTDPFEPFAYSSYSKYSSNRVPGSSYGSPALPFNNYGQFQDQSFTVPNPQQKNFMEEQSEDMNGMMNDDIQSQRPTSNVNIFDYEDMQENEELGHFPLTDDAPQNSRFSNVPNRFDDSFMMPSGEEDTRQDFNGPNTFPLNFRNPNVDGENTDFNIFNSPFQTDGSQGPFQQNQQYDGSLSFSPYQSDYNVLRGNHPTRFYSRYPNVGQRNPFNSYVPFDFYYPSYDNYNSFRSPGLYPPRPVRRYSMDYRFNYPTPLW